MLVAGGHDVLRQVGCGRSKAPCGSGKDARVFRRRDLKGRMTHPFHPLPARLALAGPHGKRDLLNYIEFVTKAKTRAAIADN